MALTAQEEQQIKDLLALYGPLIDLGTKSTEIESNLGYEDVRVLDLPQATELSGSEVMYVAQQDTDVKATSEQFGQYVFDDFAQPYITQFLATKANIDGPVFTGSPSSPTPQLFDNGTRIATTKFVQDAVGNRKGTLTFTAGGNQVLTLADLGKDIILSGAVNGTLKLPTLASMPRDGLCFRIKNESNGTTWTVITDPADGAKIVYNKSEYSTLDLLQDDYVEVSRGNGRWRTFGTAILKTSGSFLSVKGAFGYQYLPGEPRTMIQWGFNGISNGNGAITFPQPFANECSAVVPVSINSVGLTNYLINCGVPTKNGCPVYGTAGGVAATFTFNYIAIGY